MPRVEWLNETEVGGGLLLILGFLVTKPPLFTSVMWRAELRLEKSLGGAERKKGGLKVRGGEKKLLEAFGGDRQLTLGGRVTVRERSDFLLVL